MISLATKSARASSSERADVAAPGRDSDDAPSSARSSDACLVSPGADRVLRAQDLHSASTAGLAPHGARALEDFAREHAARLGRTRARWDRALAAIVLVEALAAATLALASGVGAEHPSASSAGAGTAWLASAFAAPALVLALFRPGAAATRHALALAVMLVGSLWIGLASDAAPAQVLALASIAMLSPYRDPRVFLTAIAAGALAHFVPFAPALDASDSGAVLLGWLALLSVCAAFAVLFARSNARDAVEARETLQAAADRESRHAELERELDRRAIAQSFESARAEAVLGSALDAIVTLDPDLAVVDLNPAAERLFGCSRVAAAGRPLERLVEANGSPGSDVRGRLETSGALAGRPVAALGRVQTGGTFPCELVLAPIGGRAPRAYVAQVRDHTERAACERARQDAARAAESARLARTESLASISHEMRTPLHGILGMTALCLDAKPSPEQREALVTIRESGERLLAVIEDVLESARLESGKATVESVVFALRDGVGAEVESLASRAHEQGLELVLRVAPDVPDFVRGDPRRLRQVVRNVVGNAIQRTREGEVVVDVRLAEGRVDERASSSTASESSDVQLHVSVRDSGVGISPDRRASAFDPCVQGDGSATRGLAGHALGLSVTRGLVELLGGRMWLESEVGAGTTTHCLVTFGAVRMVGASSRSGATRTLAGRTALLVDDHSTSREVERELLRELGIDVVCAGSAKEALELLRRARAAREPFDLALVDQHMPDVDGVALIGRMQGDPLFASTGIVLLGSAFRPMDVAEAQAHSIAAVVRKPVQAAALRSALEIACEDRAEEPHIPLPSALDAREPRARKRVRVLLAEDHPVNEKLAVHLLQKRGFDVTVARNGREALEHHERAEFDVLLTDIQMPERSGFDVAAAVREREKGTLRRLPIVALTAHALPGDRERFLAAGMDDHVAKPIRAGDLYAALDRALCGGHCASVASVASHASGR